MSEKKTLTDKVMTKLKNNPVIAIIIVFGTIIIVISAFTGAVQNLLGLLPDEPKKPSYNIDGYWVADKTDKTPYTVFNFKVIGNQVVGTVKRPPTFSMSQGISGIIDGQVIADSISFRTRHEYIKRFGTYNFETGQRSPDIEEELVTHYKGKIDKDTIRFIIQTDDGFYAECIARKVIDRTIVPSNEPDRYTLLFALPGHEKGVYSLSFGPEDGRYANGGLRLASGGVEDCMVKWWNLATAEFYGEDNICRNLPEGKASVIVTYKPKKRDVGAVEVHAISIPEHGYQVAFCDWSFFPNHSGRGRETQEIKGFGRLVAISADLTRIATAEKGELGKSLVSVRYPSGRVEKMLDCKRQILAIALNKNANWAAVAEKMESGGSNLLVWNIEDQSVSSRIESEYCISVVVFSPNDKFLATGNLNNGIVEIREVPTGALRFSIPPKQNGAVSLLAFSDDGKLLAAGGLSSNIIRIFDAENSFTLKQTLNTEWKVGALAFSRNSRLIAAGAVDKTDIKIWGKAN